MKTITVTRSEWLKCAKIVLDRCEKIGIKNLTDYEKEKYLEIKSQYEKTKITF